MKRLIFATIVLLMATILVTVFYFRNLNATTRHTSEVLRTIPNDAAIVFEFNNDKDFYDIFAGNQSFKALLGQDKIDELAAVRRELVLNPLLNKYVSGQNIYLSLHPQKGNNIDFLLTAAVSKEFRPDLIRQLAKQPKNGMLVNENIIGGKLVYVIYLNDLKRRFYLMSNDEGSLAGSFSKEIIEDYANYDFRKEKQAFVLLPDQQSANSLANLYVNYEALSPLFAQLFKNTDILRTFRQLPAFAALSLNYRSDAIMFNGFSKIPEGSGDGYLSVFRNQQPVANRIKSVFPSTTAYGTSFAVSDPAKFQKDLLDWQSRNGFRDERDQILKKLRSGTGISLAAQFKPLLGNEFAIVTTRYREKIGIIQVTDGARAFTLMANISRMINNDSGQLNYDKLPQVLFGEPFSIFKRPYFKVMDNYLVLTNSLSELNSYTDSYVNRKFLSKTDGYDRFNDLMTEKSNISFMIQFRNSAPLFKIDMKPAFYQSFKNIDPGWKNFYGACWQFSSSEKNYYTNFGMRLSTDTTSSADNF
ncbi:MAG: hypothetical protein JST19_06475 [Bacteroidetes bacterium]|nr:hypothetical protein [Bacteroidota bacterium]